MSRRRSSCRARSEKSVPRAEPSARARKHSSAMLSAARTAIFSVSPTADSRTASCILRSTYPASSATYVGSRCVRIRYRCPLISTVTSRGWSSFTEGLEIQRVDLFEHVLDAAADLLALRAQRRQLGARAFRRGKPPACGVELGAQPRVLLGRARVVGARPIQNRDELFQLLFEAIDGLELDRCGGYRGLGHAPSPPGPPACVNVSPRRSRGSLATARSRRN